VLVDAGDDIFAAARDELKVEVATDCIFSEQVIVAAAGAGHVHVLRFLREHGCTLHESACMGAAAAGQLTALRWLREAGCSWSTSGPPERCIAIAGAKSGSVEVMQYLQEQSVPFDYMAFLFAVAVGSLPVCKFLRTVGCPWSKLYCYVAAHHGHVEVLQWLFELGCSYEIADMARWAGTGGSVAVMALIEAAVPADARSSALRHMLLLAGGSSHLAAAQWLRAQGAEWPPVLRCTIYVGAQQGFVVWSGDVLAWARAEGCTSPTQVQNGAAPVQNVPAVPAAV
jgi:hypothetical protein